MQYKVVNPEKMTDEQRARAIAVAQKGYAYLKVLREYIDDTCVWEIQNEEMANQISHELDHSERCAMESVYLALLAAGIVDEDDPIFEHLLKEKVIDDTVIDADAVIVEESSEKTITKTIGTEETKIDSCGIPCTPPPLPEWYKRATASQDTCEEQAKELLLPATVRPPIETGIGPALELPPADKSIPQWVKENATYDRAREKDDTIRRPPIPCIGNQIEMYTEDDVMRAVHGDAWQNNACGYEGSFDG